MGQPSKHTPVKLIMGFIFNDTGVFEKVKMILAKKFGAIDFESNVLPFTYTEYYKEELGDHLKRKFISFEKLILPELLADIKLLTNNLEKRFSTENKRQINIDPGYISLSQLVLATTKDYMHRIYLDKGIYAEVTLFYQNKKFNFWPWTYPDYKTDVYNEIFNTIRKLYIQKQITDKK